MRVLGLGTFPIIQPVHGGQRRVDAIRAAYACAGIPYEYIAIAGRGHRRLGPNDLSLPPSRNHFGEIGESDICSGFFASKSTHALAHVASVIGSFRPTHVQLEAPFIFPVFERLWSEEKFSKLRLIYSSQNVERPLQQLALQSIGSDRTVIEQVTALVDDFERAAATRADVVIASAQADAAVYRSWGCKNVIVCRNGATPFQPAELSPQLKPQVPPDRFLLTIGSGHPPNAAGFLALLGGASLFQRFRMPIVVAGGMADAVRFRRSKEGWLSRRLSRLFRPICIPEISDDELAALKHLCHAFLLPIQFGGGSNLKTAEALWSGKLVVSTSFALREFEEFCSAPGVLVADTPREFQRAAVKALAMEPLKLSSDELADRRSVTEWTHTLAAMIEWAKATQARSG